ncbi:MAG: ATP-binding protein [Lutibacter sp.]
MKKYLWFFFLLLNFISFGQNQIKIDSLKNLLKTSKTKEEKAVLNLSLSKIYTTSNKKLSEEFANKSIIYITNKTEHQLQQNIYLQLGLLNYNQKKDNIALRYFSKIDSLFAVDYKLNNASFNAKIYRSEISKFTFTMEGVMQAKKYILEALELAKEHKNIEFINEAKFHLAQWHGFISQEISPKQNLDTASVYINEIIPFFKEKNNFKFLAKSYHTLASIAMALKKYKSAEIYYNKRLQIIKETKDSLSLGEAYYSFGLLFRRLKQPNKGMKYLDSALLIFNKTGFRTAKRKKDLYKDYAYLYEQKGDYKNAFNNMYKALLLKDTIYDNENTKQAMELEKKYETQKKEHQIKLLKAEKEIAKQQKINEQNLFITGIGLTTLAGIFFFFLYKNKQKTTKKLKELDQLKNDFIQNISHEFKTPLTLISGPLQSQIINKNLPDETRKKLKLAHKNVARLLTLTNQLLDVSNIENQKIKLEVTNQSLYEFVSLIIDGYTLLAKDKNIEFQSFLEKDETSWFDKDLVEKIISNLLSNALKYTPEKGFITCNANFKNDLWNFEIINSGKGIKEDDQNQIFNRFFQANRHTEGIGIGLALVKNCVDAHKGSIDFSSKENQTTTFKVTIPVEKKYYSIENSDLNETHNKTDLTAETKKELPILLVVEDNSEVQSFIASLFDKNFKIITADNGKKGIDLALKNIPDIIITDLMMPIKNGNQLCTVLKNDEKTSHIPIILLTAKSENKNRIQSIKAGADAYVEKPFKNQLLIEQVNQLIQSRKLLQQRYSQEIILKPKDIAVTSVDEVFLDRVQKILDNNVIESSFQTQEFCKAVSMSRMQLHRKLKALTGLSTSEFIRSQRLKLAAELLKQSDIIISQVGYSVGFNNHAYFSKCFKKMYHCTPTEFAKKSKE